MTSLRERTGMNRTNILESYTGTIRIGNRWPRKNQYKGPPDLPSNFQYSKRVDRCLDSLQVLQFKRNQYLLGETLAVPLQFLHDSLPYMVQRDVNIFRPIHEDIWTTPFNLEGIDDSDMQEFIELNAPLLSGRQYQFWPIDMNQNGVDGELPHWGLIVLHLVHAYVEGIDDPMASNDDELLGPYNYLESFAVITPDHGSKARALEDDVANTLLTILPRMGIDVVNAPQITPPSNREHWSSGIRVFEMIRIWLERITKSYCENPHWHDGEGFWVPHSGWINVDAVRVNMIGMAAEMINRSMNNTTRIAIEPILDYEMQNTHTGEVIRTQSIAASRRRQGAFLSGQSRKNPVWLEDTPEKKTVTANAAPTPRADSNDVGGDENYEEYEEEEDDEENEEDEGDEEDEEDDEEEESSVEEVDEDDSSDYDE
ncbi:hypothetical protein GGR51DRAFT_566888 [Nemania sp. FL0031]|nr:hypothetical protein GGR51DRAFT_566888 [Nemania sp. FL0031]